ncbi:hypothetical protein CHK_1706 [Christensenella hongkongensis]|uniref:Uncharacterized protein n=1 Tax=Christensenella hongkongensis TaxID=270498 RepID=A0A0M2NKK4_9FIRM|nr:hypothetical protein CHK_1706 [Christensenella hongkongensis]
MDSPGAFEKGLKQKAGIVSTDKSKDLAAPSKKGKQGLFISWKSWQICHDYDGGLHLEQGE